MGVLSKALAALLLASAPAGAATTTYVDYVDIAPSTAAQTAANVPMLRLDMWSEGGVNNFNGLDLEMYADAPAGSLRVNLINDDDADGVLDPGETVLSSAPFSATFPPFADLNFANQSLGATTRHFFITVDYSNIPGGRSIGLAVDQILAGTVDDTNFPIFSSMVDVVVNVFAKPTGFPTPTANPSSGGFDTGLFVNAGRKFFVTATGLWDDGAGPIGPAGRGSTGGVSGGNIGSLMGRIGGGAWFQVGAGATMTATQAGVLYLAMNDTSYTDNSGSVVVDYGIIPSTVTRIWIGGTSGLENKASVGSNWFGGEKPYSDEKVFFGGAAVADCHWDIPNVKLAELQISTGFARTLKLEAVGTGAANQLTVANHLTVSGGGLSLGHHTLEVQGVLTAQNGAILDVGSGWVRTSGITVRGNAVLRSTANFGAQLDSDSVGGSHWPLDIRDAAVNVTDLFVYDPTYIKISSNAAITAFNGVNIYSFSGSSPTVILQSDAPITREFREWYFAPVPVANVDATQVAPGSSITFRDADGADFGSLNEIDPAKVVFWLPDGGGAGDIAGTIDFPASGLTSGFKVLVTTDPAGRGAALDQVQSLGGGLPIAFSFTNLRAPNTWYLFGWHGAGATLPEGLSPRGGHLNNGSYRSAPVFLPNGGNLVGKNVVIGPWFYVNGAVTLNTTQTGQVRVHAWTGMPPCSTCALQSDVVVTSTGSFDIPVPGAPAPIGLLSFVDVNQNNKPDPFEAQGASQTLVLTSNHSGVNIQLNGGAAAPGGTVYVTVDQIHGGFVRTAGRSPMLKLRVYSAGQPASLSAIRVAYSGALPQWGPQLMIYEDSAGHGEGILNEFGEGADVFKAGTFLDPQIGVTSATLSFPSADTIDGSTRTYFVIVDHSGTPAAFSGVTIVSSASFSLGAGQMGAQSIYPIATGTVPVRISIHAGFQAFPDNTGGQNTGIRIFAGQTLTLTAVGTWRTSFSTGPITADGEGPTGQNTILPSARVGELIGRIQGASVSDSTPWFRLGASTSVVAAKTGELIAVMNDLSGAYYDNGGELFLDYSISGSTTGAISGIVDYRGSSSGNLVIEARRCHFPGNCGSYSVERSSVHALPGGDSLHPYTLDLLPPGAYQVYAYNQGEPNKFGRNVTPIDIVLGSTISVNVKVFEGTSQIDGTISYNGVLPFGNFQIGVTTRTDFDRNPAFFGGFSTTTTGSYSVGSLQAPNTYYLIAFRDGNFNGQPDGPEPFGYFGTAGAGIADFGTFLTPIYITTAGPTTGVNVTLNDMGSIGGDANFAPFSGGTLVVEARRDNKLENRFHMPIFPQPFAQGLRYAVPALRPGSGYSVFGYLDSNNDGVLGAGEPFTNHGPNLSVPTGGELRLNLDILSAPAPAQPAGFRAEGRGNGVEFTWTTVAGASQYRLLSSTGGALIALGHPTSSYLDSLPPNTSSQLRGVVAVNANGTSSSSTVSGTYALAATPSSLSTTTVWTVPGQAFINWGSLNPVDTIFELWRATDANGVFQRVMTEPFPGMVDTGLAPQSTYYWKARALNGNLLPSGFSNTASTVTPAATDPSISGILTYPGRQNGNIKVQFSTMSSFAPIASSTTLPGLSTQTYYSGTLGAGSYFIRAFVDVDGDSVPDAFEDKASVGGVVVAGSPVGGIDFAIAVDTVTPAAPVGLKLTPGFHQIRLGWTPPAKNSDGSTLVDLRGFVIQRTTGTGMVDVAITGNVTFYVDAAPVLGQQNYYRVLALDLGGNRSAPTSTLGVAPGLGGTITGSLVNFSGGGSTGLPRIRLSTSPQVDAAFLAESSLSTFSFTGLADGTYFLRGFRDDDNDRKHNTLSEPGGTHGGLNNPFPLIIAGGNAVSNAHVTLCSRQTLQISSMTSGNLTGIDCPALDKGPGHVTDLYAFRVGGGGFGTLGVGSRISLTMSSSYDNELILLGPDGRVLARDNRAGGFTGLDLVLNQAGIYLVQPTSFNPGTPGAYTLNMHVIGNFAGQITGNVSYSGSQSGDVFVQLFNTPDSNGFPMRVSSQAAPGGFALTGLQDGFYYLRAFRDANGNLVRDPGEAQGVYGVSDSSPTAVFIQGGVTFPSVPAEIRLVDPAVGAVKGAIVYEGSKPGAIRVEAGLPDPFCGGGCTEIREPVSFSSTGTGNSYFLGFLPPATNYIVQAYVDSNSNKRADPLEARVAVASITVVNGSTTTVGLVILDPGSGAAGAATVRGAISYAGTLTGPVWLGLARDKNFSYIDYVTLLASTGAFVRSGLAGNATYYMVAFMDVNGNGEPEERQGEPLGIGAPEGWAGGTPSFENMPPIVVPLSGSVTANLTLEDAPTGSISGRVSYSGVAPVSQNIIVAADFMGESDSEFDFQSVVIPRQAGKLDYSYTLNYLMAGSSFNVSAFIDANGNNRPDFGEPFSHFGFSDCGGGTGPCFGSPVAVSSGPGTFPTYGVNIFLNDPGTGGSQFSGKGTLEGEVFYLGTLSGPFYMRIFNNSNYAGTPLHVIRVPETGNPPAGPAEAKFVKTGLDFGSYSVDAFRDPSGSGVYNPLVHPRSQLGTLTLGQHNSRAFVNGPAMTDLGGGGSVNQFTGSFAAASGVRFDGGSTDLATTIAIDSVTAGGPYVYLSGITTQNDGAKMAIVRLSSTGVVLSSTTLPDVAAGHVARMTFAGELGKLFVGAATIPSFMISNGSVLRYSKELALEQSLVMAPTDIVNDIAYHNGHVYLQLNDETPGSGAHLRKLDALTFVHAATGTFSFPGSGGNDNSRTMGMALDPDTGDVYAAMASSHDEFGAVRLLLKYGPNLDGSGAPLQTDITALPFGRDLTMTARGGNVYLGLLSHDRTSAQVARFNSSLVKTGQTPALTVKASLGAGLGNIKIDEAGDLYTAWTSTANAGDCLVNRYDSSLNLVRSRLYDGLDNTRSDGCFSLEVFKTTSVFVGASVDNGRNLDWAALRLDMTNSGATSAAGTQVAITTSNAVRAVWGNLTYAGSQVSSGTLRAFLLPAGTLEVVRTSTAAFGASRQYLFNNLADGVYDVRAFIDANDNLVADAGEPVAWSSATGIRFTGSTIPGLNWALCDRLQLSTAPTVASLTSSDCRAVDKEGAFQKLYTFHGKRGQPVTLEMTGLTFYDTYLTLYDDLGKLVAFDDESAGKGNARLSVAALPKDALYTVGASAFVPGITGSFRLEFGGSQGTLGSIAGEVEYTGSQGGQTVVGLFNGPQFSSSTSVASLVLAGTRSFTFSDLPTGTTYYLGSFIDVNFNFTPDNGEDGAVFGTLGQPAPIYLENGQQMTGLKVLIEPSTAALASQAFVSGEISYAGVRTGPVRLEFWSNAAFSGRPVALRDLPHGPGFYDVGVPGGLSYFVRAFLDSNNDFLPNPDEPRGVYSPSNQGAESFFAPSAGSVPGINITMRDPGNVGGTIAGEGTASMTPSSIGAGDGVFTATITYTAGPSGIAQNGKVGFTLPPGFPLPSSVVANSTVAVSAVTLSGPSAIVTVTDAAGFAPGHKLDFVLTGAFTPCQLGVTTFTVSSVRTSAAPPQPLFSGSPTMTVLPGAPRFFQPANPYFSLRAGELSEAQRLELRDGCGNRTAALAAKTAVMRAKSFDPATFQFAADPAVGLSTSVAVSTGSEISLPFAVGQSSHPFFVVSASTGFKNLELFFDLGFPTTFYNGLTVLSANALTAVRVATAPAGLAGDSVTIGAQQQAFINFSLEDENNGWQILISSVPFKSGVEPRPVWERWGFGQPASGEISWDGRFSPWINNGARVPNGLYYVRVQVGGAGVRDDRLQIRVSVPQVAGRVFDAGVTPNPPLGTVRLEAFGPNGYQTTITDDGGNYTLAGMGTGVNKLMVRREDFLQGEFSLTVTAGGTVSTFTALTTAVSGSLNGQGGIDILMNRAPSLRVVPSVDVTVSTAATDRWGSLQVRSSTSASQQLSLFAPLRLPAGTTTFDDGGQWDPATQQFVTRTQFKFNVAVGTYTVEAFFPGLSITTASVHVPVSGATLALPPFTVKGVVTGSVRVPAGANPQGTFISANAVPLSTAATVAGGFGGVFLPPGVESGTYTVAGLDAGSYLIRVNAQGFVSLTTGPVAVTLGQIVSGVNFPQFGTGASITGNATVDFDTTGKSVILQVNAWSPGSLNFGSTNVFVNGAGAGLVIPYAVAGLSPGATYQLFVDLHAGDGRPIVLEPLPAGVVAPGTKNFTFVKSSGTIRGTIVLPAGNTDFLNVQLSGKVIDSPRPHEIGQEFSERADTLPGFQCYPSNSAPVAGACPVNESTGTFAVFDQGTETMDLTVFYRTTGATVKRRLAVVSGSTSTIFIDLTGSTFTISGTINNQITNSLFNTNPKLVANAPFVAPSGWPAALSSTTARVVAIRQEITDFKTAISTGFDESTTRVGYIAGNGTFTITNVPSGVYLLRTANLRACATCSVLVPSVSRVVRVAGASVSDIQLALSDGYSVSGSISLDGGLLDSRSLEVILLNRRQEVVRSTNVFLGDAALGVTANSVAYSFTNLPANDFYTLVVKDTKYAGRPIKFPDPGLSPNGLASDLVNQNVTLQRAAFLIGRLRDGVTGELIGATNATLLAPNFTISATANPWVEGGFVTAKSSVSGRPIEGDGYFRVGPLIPNVSYDLRMAQTSWDGAFLAQGSQNYTPVQVAGLTPTPGESKDVGVIGLHQGQSLTGVIRATSTLAALGGIKLIAKPSFSDGSVVVQTYSDSQGRYTLWVSTYISKQFDVIAAPREGNLASDGFRYGEVTLRNVNLLATTTADFLLQPLLASVTGQVKVTDGELSYPFGDQRGFPAAAINMQPAGVVPVNDPLGDISAVTDARGVFSVPGLSTGVYTLRATSLGYSVYTTTIAVSTSGATAGIITLQRGATVTGRILKSDGSSPSASEVGGVAAANFAAGEFVIGSVEVDPTAKTVSAYSISGFKPGVTYDVVILPADKTDDVSFPPEGDDVTFAATESTGTKNITLTFSPSGIDCAATAKALGNNQFQVKIDCTKALRNTLPADNDLDALLTLASGAGQLLGSDKVISADRRRITAVYRAAAGETTFSLRLAASAATVDPKTGSNFAIDKTFQLFTGVDANVQSRVANINGGSVSMQPSAQDEQLGLDERSRIDLQAGTFALDSDPNVPASTISVTVGMRKGKDQQTLSALYMRNLGYTPSSVASMRMSAFPDEMAAAMERYRVLASTKVGGANPLSSFYDIFLPAGIRHQLHQLADLTLSYDLSGSTGTSLDAINVWYYNPQTGKYEMESRNRRVDPVNKTITVSVNHFSVFVVLDSTPVASRANPVASSDITVANFPNPADCIVHTNIPVNAHLFSAAGVHAPFKGTMIRASLPGSVNQVEEMKINIYNLAGELVKEIRPGPVQGQFTHYVPWDCTNNAGGTVASGIYLGEVRWAGRSKFVKIAIIKGSGL